MSFALGLRIPSAVPVPPSETAKSSLIEGLRSRILSLERHAPRRGSSSLPESLASESASLPRSPRRLRWELGCLTSDGLLPKGLEPNALHEIKGEPSAFHGASAADWMAGIGFAARLAVRRVDALAVSRTTPSLARPWVLWCWPRPLAGEFGSPSAAGFLRLGLDPSRLIIVETGRASEALNAI